MPLSSQPPIIDGHAPDGADPRVALDFYRRELNSLRQTNGSGPDGVPAPTQTEQRLAALIDRLDHTAAALERLVGREPPPDVDPHKVMAREADHRIKNSLQTILALLRRQARETQNPEVTAALQTASARILAVASVHQTLYADEAAVTYTGIELANYLPALCASLAEALGLEDRDCALTVALSPLEVPADTAQKLGLLVTELVTNSARHAFPDGRPGAITVTGAPHKASYRLSIQDNGSGLPGDFDLRQPTGLGLRLVSVLADQLRIRVSVEKRPGARFTLTLPPTANSPHPSAISA